MFSYTTILAPFMLALTDLINGRIMTLNEIIGCGMSLGIGVTTLAIKNLVKKIWNRFTKRIKTSENIYLNKDYSWA